MKSIGIVGVGKMGQAIVKGMTGKHFAINFVSRGEIRLEGATQVASYADLVDCDAILLCVKPNDLAEASAGLFNVIQDARAHPLIISVVAGKKIVFLERCFPGERMVRAMPNLAAGAGKSVTCFSAGTLTVGKDILLVEQIFDSFGSCMQLNEENLDAASVLCGSGPAFFFYFTQKLAEAGVKAGLDEITAGKLARSVLVGTARMAENSQESAVDLIKKVVTPGGFTEAALSRLDSSKVGDSVAEAVKIAKEKCAKIGGEQK